MDAVKDSVSPLLLILVVAYNAASTLKGVLERIPDTITGTDCRVLIIDDASLDQTFEVGILESQLNDRVEVLVNPVNLGYGGNLRIGYQYSIENRFKVIVLLHGDSQYPPEKLEELVEAILCGEADAVFGTRTTEGM